MYIPIDSVKLEFTEAIPKIKNINFMAVLIAKTAIFIFKNMKNTVLKLDLGRKEPFFAQDEPRRRTSLLFFLSVLLMLSINNNCEAQLFKRFKKSSYKDKSVSFSKKTSKRAKKASADNICQKARAYIGQKYCYGGESPSTGFDCSGLTQYVYKQYSYNLPRTANQQSKVGKKIRTKKAETGDLLFFGKGKRISHVGIVLSNDRNGLVMIHASSSQGVTETNINNSSYWKKRLKKARKIIQ